jgi:cyclopropane fatty-acyl-phospholipid synthase-like methyltransferase
MTGHAHEHEHEQDRYTQDFWDERYRSAHSLWSGNPNPHLIAEASDLTPGTALEAAAGEGADAIWLARRGWQVTAVDVSAVALERAAAHAAQAGPDVAGRIAWRRENLLEWQPPERAYDLVNVQFFQLPAEIRRPVFARLAAAVANGGTLLIVGHDISDLHTIMPRPPRPELFFSGDDLAADIGDGWKIETNVSAPRQATHEGQPVTIHDTVFRASRA